MKEIAENKALLAAEREAAKAVKEKAKVEREAAKAVKEKVKADKEISQKQGFDKVIEVISKNSRVNSESVSNFTGALKEAQAFNPMNDVADRIRNSILEASKVGLSSSAKEMRYEIEALKKSEQLLDVLATTDTGKAQAAQLKKLLDITKKTLKQNTTFSKRFGGYLVENAKSKIGDAMEQVPFVGPLYAWIRESRKQALEDRKDASQTAIKDSIDLMNSDMNPIRSEAKESSKNASKSIKSTEYLEEIDKTTKETLSVAMRVAGISAEQLEAERMSIPSEENEREKVRLDNKILSTLEDIAEGSANNNSTTKSAGGISGIWSTLLAALGLGAGGGIVARFMGFFGKIKGFFGGIGRLVTKIPGVSMLTKAAGKLFSFPLQFCIGLASGLKAAIETYWETGSLSDAAMAGLGGFADWFLVGFLDSIKNWVSNNGVFEKIFGAIYEVEKFIEGAGGSKATQTGGLQVREVPIPKNTSWMRNPTPDTTATDKPGTPSATPAPKSPASFLSGMIDTFNETQKIVTTAISPKVRASTPAPKSVPIDPNKSKTDEEIIDGILRREGGFVNDPNDRGGATNRGITIGTLSDYMGKPATVDDVKNLDEKTAREIYRKQYVTPFDGVKDQNLRELAIDSGVNHGPARAAKWLKESESKGLQGQELYDDVVNTRQRFYDGIVDRDPTQSKFYKGWMNRLDEFRGRDSGMSTMAYAEPDMTPSLEQETAEMTYENQSQAATSSVGGSSVIAPNNSRSTTVNNRNTTQTTMQIPVRHQDATLFKFNPVLV